MNQKFLSFVHVNVRLIPPTYTLIIPKNNEFFSGKMPLGKSTRFDKKIKFNEIKNKMTHRET